MQGELAALAASLCWAVGSHLFGRIGRTTSAPPGAMNLGKCATGLALFAATATIMHGVALPRVSGESAGWLGVSGLIGLALGDWSYFGAIVTIGVRRALLLLSTAPVWTAIGGALWLHERITPRDALAIACVLGGVALVVREETPASAAAGSAETSLAASGNKPASLKGVLFGVGAGLGQAVGSLLSKRAMSTGVSALDASLVRLAAGFVGIIVIAAATGRLAGHARALARGRTFFAIAVSASVGTFGGIWLAQYAIANSASTAIATTLLATSPVFALPIGRWVNQEIITRRAVAGTVLATAGLILLTAPHA